MRTLRVGICQVMALLGAVAVSTCALTAWWNWHHEMLRRSSVYRTASEEHERKVAALTRSAGAQMKLIQHLEVSSASSKAVESARQLARDYGRSIKRHEQRARDFERAATFPWVKVPTP